MQSAPSPAQHPHIFLSYSDDDQALARQLQQELEAAGADVRDTAGPAREAASADVLRQYDYLVIILTPATIASSRVQAEAFTALELQRAAQGSLRSVLVFVAQAVDPAAIPPSWIPLQRIDATQAHQSGVAWLLAALGLSAAQSTIGSTLREPDAPQSTAGSTLHEPEPSQDWDGTLRDAAPPDLEKAAPQQPAQEAEEKAGAPPAPDWDVAREHRSPWDDTATSAPGGSAGETGETGKTPPAWEDTPTIIAPGRPVA